MNFLTTIDLVQPYLISTSLRECQCRQGNGTVNCRVGGGSTAGNHCTYGYAVIDDFSIGILGLSSLYSLITEGQSGGQIGTGSGLLSQSQMYINRIRNITVSKCDGSTTLDHLPTGTPTSSIIVSYNNFYNIACARICNAIFAFVYFAHNVIEGLCLIRSQIFQGIADRLESDLSCYTIIRCCIAAGSHFGADDSLTASSGRGVLIYYKVELIGCHITASQSLGTLQSHAGKTRIIGIGKLQNRIHLGAILSGCQLDPIFGGITITLVYCLVKNTVVLGKHDLDVVGLAAVDHVGSTGHLGDSVNMLTYTGVYNGTEYDTAVGLTLAGYTLFVYMGSGSSVLYSLFYQEGELIVAENCILQALLAHQG